MNVALAPSLPTRADEDFRYSDLAALEALWPVAAEQRVLAAGKEDRLVLVCEGAEPVARKLVVTLGEGARYDLRVLNCGTAFGRIEVDVELADGADFMLGAAQLGTSGQTLEIVTTVRHTGEGATSRQVVRSVLGGAATGTYLGRVAVARGATGTDAEQSVRAMLLDRTATANARPELEIFADDVKCAHGCAVGELDATGLFYLQSRGLTPAQAKRLMLQAFVAEAFVGAADEDSLNAAALAVLEAAL